MNDVNNEKISESVIKNDADTAKPKPQPASPAIGERFVPQYMQFSDWGVGRRDACYDFKIPLF